MLTLKNISTNSFHIFFALLLVAVTGYAESEPNNQLSQADPLTISQSESGNLGIDTDIYDIYSITTTQDGLLQIGAVPTAELRISLTFLDTDGISILGTQQAGTPGATAGVLYNHLRAGNYYAVVQRIDGSGDYTVTANFAPVEEIDAEPNNDPSQSLILPANGEAEGHIGFHGDGFTDRNDFYRVTVEQNGQIELTVFPDGGLNVVLKLLDADANTVMGNQNAKGAGESEKITYANIAAGTYYVLVSLADGSGSYTLTSLFKPNPEANDAEPNNRISQAMTLAMAQSGDVLQGAAEGQLGYYGNHFKDERDIYAIEVPSYGNLSFESEALDASNVQVYYVLYDGQQRYRGSSTSFTLHPGTYYVRVNLNGNYGAYRTTATFTPQTAPAAYAPSYSELAVNQVVEGVLIDADTTPVVYRLTLPADGALKIRTTFTDTVGIYGNLLHEDGQYISRTDHWFTNDPREIVVPNLHAGVYFISIQRRDGSGSGRLETEFTPAPNVDPEPNDAWHDNPVPITTSDAPKGHIGFTNKGVIDNADAYLLDIPDDGSLTITSISDDTFGYYLNLYSMKEDSTIQYLGRNDGWYTADPRSLTKPDLLAGKYLLYLERRDGYGNYEISFSFTPNRSSEPEPNDHVHQAVPIAINSGSFGHLGYDKTFYSDDVDWYRFTLPQDGELVMTTHAEPTVGIYCNLFYDDGSTYIGRTDHWYTADPRSLTLPDAKAGVYYVQFYKRDGYGAYELHIKHKPQNLQDVEQNNIMSMGEPIAVGEIAQGALGYRNRNFTDDVDYYQVQVPSAGSYKVTWQSESSLGSYCYFYFPDMKTSPFRHDRWYSSSYAERIIDLEAGTHYLQCVRRGGQGGYALSVVPADQPATGTLNGKIVSANNFPLAEVDCQIFERKLKSDFSGLFTFESLPPGVYTVYISSGAKFYAVQRDVEIVAGESTQLNVTMLESNKTAPADPAWFGAIARDRYIHFGWLASISPDVADGGGYKLYINSDEPIDLGNVLSYRSDGFANGVQYTCRLTVYDKFGNESAGVSVVVNPTGEGEPPAPTPTIPVTPPTVTPTPTVMPGSPTPTPVPTLPPGQPTPTPPAVAPTPTPPVVHELVPDLVYEFDQPTLAENSWGEIVNNPPGQVQLIDFIDAFIPSSEDGNGISITLNPYDAAGGEPYEYVFLYGAPSIQTQGQHVFMRMVCRASDPNVVIYLAAMKADFTTFEIDGSLVVNNPATARLYTNQPGYVSCFFPADPARVNLQTGQFETPLIKVMPIIQVVASPSASEPVIVWIDRIEVFLIDSDSQIPAQLFDISLE